MCVASQVFYKVHIVCFLGVMIFSAIHYSSFAVFVIPGECFSTHFHVLCLSVAHLGSLESMSS